MAGAQENEPRFLRVIGRIGISFVLIFALALFLLWRIDNPRAERLRIAMIDRVVPNMDWALSPVTKAAQILQDFQSYERIYSQNQELRRELQRMKSWREAALQFEQENARLLDLNKVKLNPKLSYISGKVLTDSGSRFRQSAIVNLGARDGVTEGWATMDGLGLVGRIVSVGDRSSQMIFVTDTTSNIPVLIKPSNQKAILSGDNTLMPKLNFIESLEQIKPGDRIVTSGDGGVFPSSILVGQLTRDADGLFRAQLAADFQRLEFVRVVRFSPQPAFTEPDRLIGPVLPEELLETDPNG